MGIEKTQDFAEEIECRPEIAHYGERHHQALRRTVSSRSTARFGTYPWLDDVFLAVDVILLVDLPKMEMDVHTLNVPISLGLGM